MIFFLKEYKHIHLEETQTYIHTKSVHSLMICLWPSHQLGGDPWCTQEFCKIVRNHGNYFRWYILSNNWPIISLKTSHIFELSFVTKTCDKKLFEEFALLRVLNSTSQFKFYSCNKKLNALFFGARKN